MRHLRPRAYALLIAALLFNVTATELAPAEIRSLEKLQHRLGQLATPPRQIGITLRLDF